MNIYEAILYSYKNLKTRSLRSWLTITGMVIGVIAIVVILSISEGFNQDIRDQLSAFGADQMFIYPVASLDEAFSGSASLLQTSGKLRDADYEDVKNVPGVKEVARAIFGRVSLSYKGKNITATVYPVDPKMFDMYGSYIEIDSGRIFREDEKNVAFFGYTAANDMFGKDKIEVGSVVQINGKNYRVVGVQKKIGGSLGSTDDANIYLPFEDGRDLFKGQILDDEISVIYVQVSEGFEPDKIKETIESKLAANHKVKEDELDFSVITSDQIMEIVGSILFTAQLVLGIITLIASVVGAIGIANTMFMNVLERIREIGILKSVGATKNEILLLFLTEAAIIGVTGGVIGLVLGVITLEILVDLFAVPSLLTLPIVAFVFLFSVGTGVLAGFLPAKRAAEMDPVQALSFE